MLLLVKVLSLIGCWALGLSCIQRALTFIPSIDLEPIPGPPIITDNVSSPGWVYAWIFLWTITGVLLIIGPIWGHKITLFSTPTERTATKFRLDDLGFFLYAAMMITWGLSYYLEWITKTLEGVHSTAYSSGGVTMSAGIFVFSVWAIYFSTRNIRGDLIGTED